jgi:hypothetical protein
MKKLSQQTIDVKREELKKAVYNALTNLDTKLKEHQQRAAAGYAKEINTLLDNLNQIVDTKIEELRGQTITVSPQKMQQMKADDMESEAMYDLPGVVKESKKKKKKKKERHPTPRDTDHNENLPPFWRRNFDYGESPYMNIGFIEKITDKPPYKKKKKKKGKK